MSSPSRLPSGAISYPVSQPAFFGRGGPYVYGGNWYVVECEASASGGTITVVAYKSTDRGVTWTRIASGLTTHNGNVSVFYPGTGALIYTAYQDDVTPTSTFRGTLFDMSSDSFTGAFTTGITIGRNNLIALAFAKTSSNKWVFMWTDLLVGVLNAITSTNSGASWAAPVAISGATPFSALESAPCINSAGNIAINWTQWADNSYFNFKRVQEFCSIYDGTTVLHTNTAIADATKIGLQDGFQHQMIYDPVSDSLLIPTMQTLSGSHLQVDLLVGTPSINPVFSTVIVFDNPAASNDFYWAPDVSTNGASRYEVLWADDIGVFPFQSVLYRTSATSLSGTWSTPSVFYDQQADPPTPTPNFGELFPLTTNILADNTLVAIVGMAQTVAPSETWCGVLYSIPDSGPLALACPIGGGMATLGVFYTGTVGVSGGIPPYLFSMTAPAAYLLWDSGFWDVAQWG